MCSFPFGCLSRWYLTIFTNVAIDGARYSFVSGSKASMKSFIVGGDSIGDVVSMVGFLAEDINSIPSLARAIDMVTSRYVGG